jgi:hypothetical protein
MGGDAMHKANGNYLRITTVAGLLLPCFLSDTCATTIGTKSTISVKANIAFAEAADLAKQSDVTAGVVLAQANDCITVDNYGATRLQGKGTVLDPNGHPSVIKIGDARNQTLNFLIGNYTPGAGISALRAHCTLTGSKDVDCDTLPIYGTKEDTLFIGMDMTIGDSLNSDNKMPPSFDMSIVYQ